MYASNLIGVSTVGPVSCLRSQFALDCAGVTAHSQVTQTKTGYRMQRAGQSFVPPSPKILPAKI